jgi:hypothetical protein
MQGAKIVLKSDYIPFNLPFILHSLKYLNQICLKKRFKK